MNNAQFMNKKVVWTFKTLVNDILPTTCYLMTNETFENHTTIVEMKIHWHKNIVHPNQITFQSCGVIRFFKSQHTPIVVFALLGLQVRFLSS
jgi:hypothetical protein